MCRLFGFRSNTAAWVHRSLLTEKNSLRTQSIEHPDGWGIAYYLAGKFPEVAHGVGPAHSDPEFERVSNLLSSHAVVAHVRSASVGRVHLSNAHPFTYQNWSFAHNGTLTNFSSHQQRLESAIDSEFLPLLRSETDSERCFLLFLTELKQRSRLRAPPVADVARALARITELVARITDEPGGKPSSMNFLVTDGTLMAATRRRKTLFFSARAVEGSPAPSDSIETRLEQVVIASGTERRAPLASGSGGCGHRRRWRAGSSALAPLGADSVTTTSTFSRRATTISRKRICNVAATGTAITAPPRPAKSTKNRVESSVTSGLTLIVRR